MYQTCLGWLYWDPARFIFTIPLIDRPVAWYGVFFAFGFFLGFLLIQPIFRKQLLKTQQISERDVANWSILITQLKAGAKQKDTPIYAITQKMNGQAQEALFNLRFKQEPDLDLKKEILHVLNTTLKEDASLSRKKLESLFPKAIFKIRQLCLYLTDRLTWFVIAGTVIGARLGHVFLYDWPRYQDNLWDIVKVWEGGLASHGGAVGVLIALFFYQRSIRKQFPELTFLVLMDCLAIPTVLHGFWIRIGNFFNQEITGSVTHVPWAIVFGHPMEGGPVLPRHPTQLYEAAAYLLIFCGLYLVWKKSSSLKTGTLSGLFMILVFGSRFLIEFYKTPQSLVVNESLLHIGQYLSIPFLLFGSILLLQYLRQRVRVHG